MTDYTGSNTPADQRDLWRTPPALFAALDAEFCFQLDAAASPHNTRCVASSSPPTRTRWKHRGVITSLSPVIAGSTRHTAT